MYLLISQSKTEQFLDIRGYSNIGMTSMLNKDIPVNTEYTSCLH